MEFIGLGDLHLSDDQGRGGLTKYIPNADQYVMSEVARACQWATKRGIKYVVFYGDICESPRMSYEAMLAFIQCIQSHPDLKFITILGNHDKQAKDSSAGHSLQIIKAMAIPNLRIIEEPTVLKIQGRRIKFLPWPSTAFDPKVLNIGHIEVSGSKGDSGRVMEAETSSKAVICMGHLHTCHQVRNTYYSGTLYQTNFGETGPKFFHHCVWNSVNDYEITSVPFDSRYKLFNCVAESQPDIDCLPKDPNHLIKLVIRDGSDVSVPDQANIVITKMYKTKSDLVQILTEDLLQGQELVIKTSDFFRDWLKQQQVPIGVKKRAHVLRKEILYGSK